MNDLGMQIVSFLKGIWKYRWYAVVTAWMVALVGAVIVYRLPDSYQSSARVFVDTESILKPLLAGMTTMPNVEQQVSIMSRTLLSRPNVERVVRMVDLDIKTNSGLAHEKLIDSLTSQIKISGTVQNDIYTITYTGQNPKLAKDVVQALLTIFVEGSFGDKKQDSKKAIQFIDDQIKAYEEKLAAAENAVKEFKLKHMGLLPQQGSDYGAKLMEASENLNRARLELAEAEQARDAIKRQMFGDESSSKSAPTSIPTDPDIDARIQALNKNLDTLRLQYTEQHPDIVAAKRLLAQLEARNEESSRQRKLTGDLGINASPALQQMKVSLSDAEARVASLRVRVQEYASRVSRLKEMSTEAP